MPTPVRWGNEEVYITGTEWGSEPEVTALANGRFVVTWVEHTENDTGLGDEVRAKILNADGTVYRDQFTVSTSSTRGQQAPNVTTLSDGRFVVIWTDQSDAKYDDGTLGQQADVYGQVFNIDGTKDGQEFKVNGVSSTLDDMTPGVTALSDGGFAVTWREYLESDRGSDSAIANIWVAQYNKDVLPVRPPQKIGESTNYSDVKPVIQEFVDGSSIVVWSSADLLGGPDDINLYGTLVKADGSTKDLGIIGSPSVTDPNNETITIQITPEITKLANGGFVVTWERNTDVVGGDNGSAFGVWARVYDGTGRPQGAAFEVSPPSLYEIDPAVTALNDGRFMITWANYTDNYDIQGQVYSSSGVKDGGTFQFPTLDGGNLDGQASITTLEDGRVVVTWYHDTAPHIRTHIIEPREIGIELPGSEHNDDYIGTNFNDTISGGIGGHDRIRGEGGNDILSGGNDNDTLDGGDGDDELYGQVGADILMGGNGRDMLFGWDDNDILDGGEGNDELRGDLGSDTLSGGNGNDWIEGGLNAPWDPDPVDPDNPLYAADFSTNYLNGGAGRDTLMGGAGVDIMNGGSGGDRMEGRNGNDTYYVDDASDAVVEASGAGTFDQVFASVSWTLTAGAYVENLTLTAAAKATGNELANVIDGSGGNDTLDGAGGADLLQGGAGDDTYYIDALDTIVDTSGFDTVVSSASVINLGALQGIESVVSLNSTGATITGSDSGGTLSGYVGNDTLNAGNANDVLNGGAEADNMNGGGGNDVMNGGAGADRMAGGTGNDV